MALAAWALITVQEAKEFLAIQDELGDDVMEGLVEAATQVIEGPRVTDRLLKSRTYTLEVHDGRGGPAIRTRQYPVTVITTVEFFDGTAWDAQDLVADVPFVAGELQNRIAFRELAFPRGWQNVRLAYTAGLVTVPPRLKQACCAALMSLYKARDKQLANVASQSYMGGQSITYKAGHVTQEILDLVSGYERTVTA